MNKYPLKSKPNHESNEHKKQIAKNLDSGYCSEIKRIKKTLEILNEDEKYGLVSDTNKYQGTVHQS